MQHPDEGTIHAWLDGQLPRDEAVAFEAHVAECRECADAVAEARGLIAASSRILTALDGVPRDVAPKREQPSVIDLQPAAISSTVPAVATPRATAPAASRARRRWFSGPSLAAAATIVVAVGTFTIFQAANSDRAERPGEAMTAGSRAAESSADSVASLASSAPLPPSAPAAPAVGGGPTVANDARSGSADNERRNLADGLTRSRRDEANAPPAEPSRTAAAPSASVARAPGAPPAPEPPGARAEPKIALAERLQRAASEPEKDLAKARERSGAIAAPRPDTVTVQVFRGAKAAKAEERIPLDSGRSGFAAMSVADAAASTGIVRGRVTDANRTALENVQVQVAGTSIGVTTSRTGEYELRGVPPGAHRVTARRIGFKAEAIGLTVAAGQAASADFTLVPSTVSVENVVVTGAAEAQSGRRAPAASGQAGQPVESGTAYGCYDLGITPATSQARSDFRQIPRRIVLDSVVVPERTDGVWYRVRDLSGAGTSRNGVWRPTSTAAIEAHWTYGTRTATLRLTGIPGQVLRGTAQEIDTATALGASATVVAARTTRCPGM
jgi:hypothetical protein